MQNLRLEFSSIALAIDNAKSEKQWSVLVMVELREGVRCWYWWDGKVKDSDKDVSAKQLRCYQHNFLP
jgi:hypothetical protein